MLAKNFCVPEAAFANLPTDFEHDRYIFTGQVPGPKSGDIVQSASGLVPHTFSHRLMEQEPIITEGGWVRITDSTNFPAATTIAAALVNIEPASRIALAPARRMAVLHFRAWPHDRVRVGRQGADL